MLCKECQSIFKGHLKPVESPSKRFLSPTDAHLKEGLDQFCGIVEKAFRGICTSASHGCYICDVIRQDVTHYWVRLSRRFGSDFAVEGPNSYPDSFWNLCWTVAFDGDSFSLAIDVRVANEFGTEASQAKWLESYLALTPLPDNVNTSSALLVVPQPRSRMEYALKWLKDCDTSHPGCNERAQNIAYPSRLLKLSSPQPGFLQLRDTAEANIHGPYMTLSHRWGTAQFLRLAAETSKELYEGIEATKLARTFQDAAVVAQALGASYLWIDSLCIFQDSAQDWRKESAIMGDIYAGGILNISAIGAADSNDTTLPSGHEDLLKDEPYKITTMWCNHENHTCRVFRRWLWQEGVDETPLMLRGWVVQERVLSPRILYLGNQQFFWECQQFQACQVFPEGIPEAYFFRLPVKRAIPTRWQQQSSLTVFSSAAKTTTASTPDFHLSWANTLNLYSTCQLTRETDKLVALSGIAKTCGEALHDRYLAGIWSSDLPLGLLWARDLNEYCQHPKSYQAPSWSWASVIGKLKFPPNSAPDRGEIDESHVDILVSVVAVDIKPWGDAFGQVKDGFVRLSGPLLTVELSGATVIISRSGTQITHYDWITINNSKVYQEDLWKWSMGLRLDTELHCITNLHFMPLLSRVPKNKGFFESWGLILQPTQALRGQFRRVGLLYIQTQERLYKSPGDEMVKISNAAWLEYEGKDSLGNFIITVI